MAGGARLAYPARVAPVLIVFAVAFLLCWVEMIYFSIVGVRPALGWLMAAQAPTLLGTVLAAMFMAWIVAPRRCPLSYWLAGYVSALLFGFPNSLIYGAMTVALVLLPHDLPTVAAVLAVGAAGFAFAAWGGGICVA